MSLRAFIKKLAKDTGVAIVAVLYAILQIASNAIQWIASTEFQEQHQFIKLLANPRVVIAATTVVTTVLIVLVVRAAWRIAKALESELLLEKERNLQPRIKGTIQAARLEPMIWAKLKEDERDVWASCDVLVVPYFANLSPVQTSLRGFGLVVSIGGNTYEAIDAEDAKPLNWSLREFTENRADLNLSIGSSAPQGLPFDGFLHFRIVTGDFFSASDEIRVVGLLVRDSFGLIHEIPPEGDGVIRFPPGGPKPHEFRDGETGKDGGEQSPPLL